MLTQKAMQDRQWGSFPALRKVLEDKSLPDSYYGLTSASDNTLDEFRRLVEVAILAREHESDVIQAARTVGPANIYNDLGELEGRLERVCSFIRHQIENVRTVTSNL